MACFSCDLDDTDGLSCWRNGISFFGFTLLSKVTFRCGTEIDEFALFYLFSAVQHG